MTEVLIAIPAHDEEAEIGACLEQVARAVRLARECPSCVRTSVAVSAHRCSDDTFEVAVAALADLPGRHLVTRDEVSHTVGQVRARLVARATSGVRAEPEHTWLLSTDADSLVPADWVVETLDAARRRGAVAVAGMVGLRGWDAPPEVRQRYQALIDAGVGPDGHTHVYGANLAVRLDAYQRVGGFRPGHGEDQDLVDRLRAAGERVVSSFSPLVRTSARHPGRAEHGLGALLQRMQEPLVPRVGVSAHSSTV
ncbi:MAG: glycosyltransferase [Marmoricola sp.]